MELDVDVLDSKLPALEVAGQHKFAQQGHVRIRKGLTARTLNSDVLPAFCSPIMVISISVALHTQDGQLSARRVGMHDFAFFLDHIAEMEVSNGASGMNARTQQR
jgi:hypothetical protein